MVLVVLSISLLSAIILMKLFSNKADAYYSDFCFIDTVSLINDVLLSFSALKTTRVVKLQQASC